MSKVACNKRDSCPDVKGCHMPIPHEPSAGCSKCFKYEDAKCIPLEIHMIRILSSQKKSDWYHNKIGQTYKATKHDSRYPPWKGDWYNIVTERNCKGYEINLFVRVDDCIIV